MVTGSRIRRVDAETASPILIIDSKAIQESGITTVGDLLQRIPSVSGAATNPSVNNGGGFGESSIELRGLDAKRTLILVDGHRIGFVGTTSDATDVNEIPFNMIDHVEVLKQGAGAIYGSDAIAGVVNFITRKDLDGLELPATMAAPPRPTARITPLVLPSVRAPTSSPCSSAATYSNRMGSLATVAAFQNMLCICTAARPASRKVAPHGVPTGRIYSNPLGQTGSDGKPCSSVTRIAGASGAALTDYRCFASPGDLYNFQPLNLLTTPVERTAFFGKANYKINDDIEAYASVTQTHTHSGYHAAALPFDSLNDNIVLSKDSIYNPFGVDFGGNSGVNPDFTLRTQLFGARQSDTSSDGTDFNGGVKGNLLNTGWTWDLNLTYSRLQQHGNYSGYYFGSKLNAAVGPSFLGADGTPTCGTPAAPIDGCVPVNLFNQFAATNPAALNGVSADYNVDNIYTYKAASLDFTGKIISLPAGDLQAAVGFEYNGRYGAFRPEALIVAPGPLYLSCGLSQETCSGPAIGKYNSKQEYIEINVPILKDLPLVSSLNFDAGVRHNDYSLFGTSTKADFKLEYRPIKDLLLRGTFSQVLRVPTINDIAAAPANTSATFNDPCNGLTDAKVAATPNLALACQGVPRDGSFQEPNGQVTALNESNANLKPETGKVKTAGFVFEPNFVPGFSVSADYWNYHIDGLITTLDANYTINQCVATGSPTFCGLVNRYGADTPASAGLVKAIINPSFNLGSLDTSGVDIGLK